MPSLLKKIRDKPLELPEIAVQGQWVRYFIWRKPHGRKIHTKTKPPHKSRISIISVKWRLYFVDTTFQNRFHVYVNEPRFGHRIIFEHLDIFMLKSTMRE